MADEKPVKPKKRKISAKDVNIGLSSPVVLKQTSQSSVEIKRNAKGVVEFTVKVYGDDPVQNRLKAEKVFADLARKHKYNG